MSHWTELARAATASGDEILLRQRGEIYEIRYNGIELMSNLNHHSEGVLAERSLRLLGRSPREVLIAGLGMGFTLRAALDSLGPETQITVCELIPEIIEWMRGPLAHLAGNPLADPRVRVVCGDISTHLSEAKARYDLILLDTDNGPDILVRPENDMIYQADGLSRVAEALSSEGLAAFWSATIAPTFEARLNQDLWTWRRDDIALVAGRVDAMHHIYFAQFDAAAQSLREAA